MHTPTPGSPPPTRGLGGLVTTEVDHIALGTHHGHELHARVERRAARFSAGRGWHVALGLGRARPVAIEVTARGAQYDLPIAHPRDPWLEAARRIGALAVSAVAIVALARRVRAPKEASSGN